MSSASVKDKYLRNVHGNPQSQTRLCSVLRSLLRGFSSQVIGSVSRLRSITTRYCHDLAVVRCFAFLLWGYPVESFVTGMLLERYRPAASLEHSVPSSGCDASYMCMFFRTYLMLTVLAVPAPSCLRQIERLLTFASFDSP